MLTLVATIMSVITVAFPNYYTVTYTDQQGHVVHKHIGLFMSLFEDPDAATIVAFVFLVLTWVFSACLNGFLDNVYKKGFGEFDHMFPGVACCLSICFSLAGTFSLLSLVSDQVFSLIVERCKKVES
jgi:hypothetical protein